MDAVVSSVGLLLLFAIVMCCRPFCRVIIIKLVMARLADSITSHTAHGVGIALSIRP